MINKDNKRISIDIKKVTTDDHIQNQNDNNNDKTNNSKYNKSRIIS